MYSATFKCQACSEPFSARWERLQRVACPICRWMPRPAVLYGRISPRPRVRAKCVKCKARFLRGRKLAACPKCSVALPPEKRAKGIEDSIGPQLEYCRRYCELYNLQVVAEFWDRRRSGKAVKGRPEFRKAVRLARELKGVLVAYSLSRFIRSNELACKLLRVLTDDGADLATVTERFDTSTPSGRAWFRVRAVFDELFREETSSRTSDMMRAYQAQGLRMSAQPEFGMMVDPADESSLIPCPAEQDAIVRVRELWPGNGLRQIARTLAVEGFPCRGKAWQHTTVATILERLGLRS